MQTKLPEQIVNEEQAKDFLTALTQNGELIHPEDNAHEIEWALPIEAQPTWDECEQINLLMEQVCAIPDFDPFLFCLELCGLGLAE